MGRMPLWGRLGMDPDETGKGSGAEASSLRDSIFLIIRKWHPQSEGMVAEKTD